MNTTDQATGQSSPAFASHRGYRRMFAANQLTLGIFLPLRFYKGDMAVLAGHTQHIALATGSAIFSLRHPIDLAKVSATIDKPTMLLRAKLFQASGAVGVLAGDIRCFCSLTGIDMRVP